MIIMHEHEATIPFYYYYYYARTRGNNSSFTVQAAARLPLAICNSSDMPISKSRGAAAGALARDLVCFAAERS